MHHSKLLRSLLDLYLTLRYRISFHELKVELDAAKSTLRDDLPLILVSNHLSWWDGFFLSEIQRRLFPRRPLYTFMLETELERFPVFRKIGVTGIRHDQPATLLRAFRALKKMRSTEAEFCVSFFPQGQLYLQEAGARGFKRGIETLIRSLHPVQVLPIAIRIEPLRSPRPTAIIRAGSAIRSDDRPVSAGLLEDRIETLRLEILETLSDSAGALR
jgi:1-acyl-sn-glycerol-3-phosphate acyltransferase